MTSHKTDVLSLSFALIFISIGGVFLSGRVDTFEFVSVWALPVTLLATGLVLVAVASARHSRSSNSDDDAVPDR